MAIGEDLERATSLPGPLEATDLFLVRRVRTGTDHRATGDQLPGAFAPLLPAELNADKQGYAGLGLRAALLRLINQGTAATTITYRATAQTYTTTAADYTARCGAGTSGAAVTVTSSAGSSTVNQAAADAQALADARAQARAAIVCGVQPAGLQVAVSAQRAATLTPPAGDAATDYEYQYRPGPTVSAQRVADMSALLAPGETSSDYEYQLR